MEGKRVESEGLGTVIHLECSNWLGVGDACFIHPAVAIEKILKDIVYIELCGLVTDSSM
jgi:hypothetical protein